jgi:2-epi-valiolone-7-phosphate 1-reductase
VRTLPPPDRKIPRHRAIVRTGRNIALAERPTTPPGPGELSLAPETAGLCGTDLQILRGLRDETAAVLGHEGVARVAAAGPGVDPALAPGTRVIVNPTHPDDPSFLLGHNVDGLMQERTLIPASAVGGGLVLALPAGFDPHLGPLVEPLAVVRYALAALERYAPDTLLVVGDGVIGHLSVRAAARWLGPRVRTILVHHTPHGEAFSAAAPLPADVCARLADLPLLGLDRGRVAVILATPRTGTLDALDAVIGAVTAELTIDVIGGLPAAAVSPLLPGVEPAAVRSVNCGGVPDPARVETVRTVTGRQLRLLGHRGVGNGHLHESVSELGADPARYGDLITHRADLSSAAGLLQSLAASPSRIVDGRRLIKLSIVVDPNLLSTSSRPPAGAGRGRRTPGRTPEETTR